MEKRKNTIKTFKNLFFGLNFELAIFFSGVAVNFFCYMRQSRTKKLKAIDFV